MTIEKTNISGVFTVTPNIYTDDRGCFFEVIKSSVLPVNLKFVQVNQSTSNQNVFRGLHFQKPPKMMGKLVRCLDGAIIDVIVDIRKFSLTYKQNVTMVLTSTNHKMIYAPPGFAHGFIVMSKSATVEYMCTTEYVKELDSGIIYNDPDLSISWISEFNPILSDRDKHLPTLKEYEDEVY
jgi:dTDP-4-dehydrorhamnose 3,5-epimerase